MPEAIVEGLTCLIPIFNQARTIERALSSWSDTLSGLGRPYEILVVNDGSTDGTRNVFESSAGRKGLLERIPNLQLLEHSERQGFGAALKTGLAASRQPLIFYTGCDYPYNPADLKTLLPHLDEIEPFTGQKVVAAVGYRAAVPLTGWRKVRERVWRILMKIVFSMDLPPSPGWLGKRAHRYGLLLRTLFGVRVGDVDSKFKVFRKSIFERIAIQSTGDFVHAEILAKANFLSCPIAEAAVAERPGPFPAHSEPPSPASLSKELRRVFFKPEFGRKAVNSAD